ncbi:MAG: hypothetical protein IKS20_09320, partial [Victivallales bacterium]|nr:hypothetical protein [Victivallales bacterium]
MQRKDKNAKSTVETPLARSLEAIVAALEACQEMVPQDKLAHRIMLTLQRRRAGMDWLIDMRSRGKCRPRIRRVIWWAMVEMLWMDGVPQAAVVDTAVSFIRRRYSQSEASYANGLLRGILRDVDANGLDSLFAAAPLPVRFELPEFLCKRWVAHFGEKEAARIAQCLQLPAHTILRRRKWPVSQDGTMPAGLRPVPAPDWAPDAELYEPEGNVQLSDYMGQGTQFYIQDMATLLAPNLLAPKPGENIADVCAAPGGKALLLGEMMQGKGALFCSDKAEAKLPRLKENLSVLPNVVFECHDAATSDFGGRLFDGIMLDVPCSNTGVIRRKPDVRWNLGKDNFSALLELQAAILENVSRALREHGRLVYSTCSIEDEENLGQINAFLARHPNFR